MEKIKLETDTDKKKYIIQHWSLSSGQRITDMLKRFWNCKEEPAQKELEDILLK